MKCKYCGAEIANDSVYCEQCGKFTNPFNKKGVTCSMNLVKWLLFGTMVIPMVYSYLSSYYLGISYLSFYYLGIWIRLLIPLAIFVVSLVLSIKKMLSWGFTFFIVAFILCLLCTGSYFVTGLMFWIEAGILLLYIIYEIVAASIARKRIRRG